MSLVTSINTRSLGLTIIPYPRKYGSDVLDPKYLGLAINLTQYKHGSENCAKLKALRFKDCGVFGYVEPQIIS